MATETMQAKITQRGRVGAPPLPHEHGAWVMLYAPLLIALGVAGPVPALPALLLVVAVTAAFLAKEPADLLLRGRGREGTTFWLGVYAAVMLAAAAPLVLAYGRTALLAVGGVAGVLFGIHALMLSWPARRRMDRSASGEVLAVAGLTLTAPAGYALATGRVDGFAACLWAVSILYFASSVFFVKMLLAGAKHKGTVEAADRLRLGRWSLAYHAALVAVLAWLAPRAGQTGALLIGLAYAPVILRALWWNARLSRRLPNLKRIGFTEMAYAFWFVGFMVAGLRAAGH